MITKLYYFILGMCVAILAMILIVLLVAKAQAVDLSAHVPVSDYYKCVDQAKLICYQQYK